MTQLVVRIPPDAAANERRFLEAAERLWERGTAITTENVAREAGRGSRGPITGPNARWPRVRDEIQRLRLLQRSSTRSTAADPLLEEARLRRQAQRESARRMEEVVALRAERDAALCRSAAIVLLLEDMGKLAKIERRTPEERDEARRRSEAALPVSPAIRAGGGRASADPREADRASS